MKVQPSLSAAAALIGDETRAALLVQLFDGGARTAGELARGVNVSPQTASNHLAKLLAGGLLALEAQGRHRYYRLAGPEVAQALEALSVLAPPLPRSAAPRVPADLRFARACYDHLAGELGVALTAALLREGRLAEQGDRAFAVTPAGEAWFADLGVDVAALRRGRRPLARRCLDWSERRPHLAGALGAALLDRLGALGWTARAPGRAVRLTVAGRLGLERHLGLTFPADGNGDAA